jgi:chromosome segregation ATPase
MKSSDDKATVVDMQGLPVQAPVSAAQLPVGLGQRPNTGRRIVLTCVVLSGIWLAAATATLLILFDRGLFVRIDAINLGALAAGVFAPLTAIWLAGLALLRGGPLADVEERLQSQLLALARPVEDASIRAMQLEIRFQRQVDQIDMAASTATSRFAELEAAAARQAERLINAAGALEASRTAAEAAESRLRDTVAQFAAVVGQLEQSAPSVQSAIAGSTGHLKDSVSALEQSVALLADRSNLLDNRAHALRTQAADTEQQIGASADRLSKHLGQMREATSATTQELASGVAQTDALLARTQGWAQDQVMAISTGATVASTQLEQLVAQLADQVAALGDRLRTDMAREQGVAQSALDALSTRLSGEIGGLRQALTELGGEVDQTGVTVGLRLLDAVTRTRRAAHDAVSAVDTAAKSVAHTMTAQLAEARQSATQAGADALAAITRQTETLQAMLAQVDQLSSGVQQRLNQSTQDDLHRTANTVIDSLNAASIDLARAFAVDVPEADWQAYLAGDRSVFTRRLARSGDKDLGARIAQRIGQDQEFRVTVGRYLTLFETMSGRVLKEPNATALAVTLLSSDPGRLYVVLAQATKRFTASERP